MKTRKADGLSVLTTPGCKGGTTQSGQFSISCGDEVSPAGDKEQEYPFSDHKK
jgi:hypothetical protein